MSDSTFTPSPTPNIVKTADGKVLIVPIGWIGCPPGEGVGQACRNRLIISLD